MTGAHSRRKGIRWELEVVHLFERVFGEGKVRRGLQYRSGAECADVIVPALHIEAKRGRRTNPRAALVQAIEASKGKGLWPVAVCKDDHAEPFIAMRLSDFVLLLQEWWSNRPTAPPAE
ncbi:MAG: hypothetical protein ACHREM_05285 [Polyangiales bacterium]|jgi:hypothetical protein